MLLHSNSSWHDKHCSWHNDSFSYNNSNQYYGNKYLQKLVRISDVNDSNNAIINIDYILVHNDHDNDVANDHDIDGDNDNRHARWKSNWCKMLIRVIVVRSWYMRVSVNS